MPRTPPEGGRRIRADAQRNVGSLLQAAQAVFAEFGVDAPVRQIADRAGVGVGTVYRHFARRSDLIQAVFRQEVDECAAAAASMASSNPPMQALVLWVHRYTEFVAAKRGLAAALQSGDRTFDALPDYFAANLGPAMKSLLSAAEQAGDIRSGVDPTALLGAVANVCRPTRGTADQDQPMVDLLIDGLRYRPT